MIPDATLPVRVVEWNVAMSLHKKAHLLSDLEPTIAVLPESAKTERTRNALRDIGATSIRWIGTNPNKGLLAASFGEWQLDVDASYDPGYQWVLPLHLSGPRHLRVLAVWEMDRRGTGYPEARQRGSVRVALPHYADFLAGDADLSLISGDFNASVIWDKPGKLRNFGDLNRELKYRGFVSVYHHHHGWNLGAEPDPTLWWRRKEDATYHIDYTFVSRPDAIKSVVTGSFSDWIACSDHSPTIIDLDVPCSQDGTR